MKAEIEYPGERGHGSIKIDGERLRGCTGFTLTYEVSGRGLPQLTVDLVVHETSYFGDIDIYVSDRARETLLKFGWTPPLDEARP